MATLQTDLYSITAGTIATTGTGNRTVNFSGAGGALGTLDAGGNLISPFGLGSFLTIANTTYLMLSVNSASQMTAAVDLPSVSGVAYRLVSGVVPEAVIAGILQSLAFKGSAGNPFQEMVWDDGENRYRWVSSNSLIRLFVGPTRASGSSETAVSQALAINPVTGVVTGIIIAASGVAFSPTGAVAATTVQAAIAELDSEKVPTSRVVNAGSGLLGGGGLSGDITLTFNTTFGDGRYWNASNLNAGTVPNARLPTRVQADTTPTTNWNTVVENGFYSSNRGIDGVSNTPDGGGGNLYWLGYVVQFNGWIRHFLWSMTQSGSSTQVWTRLGQPGVGFTAWERGIGARAETDARYGQLGVGNTWAGSNVFSSSLRFSSFGAGTLVTDASGNVGVSSDERLKTDVQPWDDGLDRVLDIRPVSYRWNDRSGMDRLNTYYGFSAQDVERARPEAVGMNRDGTLGVNLVPIVADLINTVRRLKARLNALESA